MAGKQLTYSQQRSDAAVASLVNRLLIERYDSLYVSHRFELGCNFARYPDWKLANGLRRYRGVRSRYDVNDQ